MTGKEHTKNKSKAIRWRAYLTVTYHVVNNNGKVPTWQLTRGCREQIDGESEKPTPFVIV